MFSASGVGASTSRTEGSSDPLVVPVHGHEESDDHRHRCDDDPRAATELRDDHDDEDQTGGRRADGVDDHAPPPPRLLQSQPASDHPQLGQGEGGEDADDVELDQAGEVRVERVDQAARRDRQDDDPVREHEPISAVAELRRHESVSRQDRGEPREVLVRRVGREDQDPRREPLKEEVEERSAEHRLADLGQHRARSRDLVVHVNVEQHREDGDPEEHRDRHDGHHREGRGGVLRLGAPEGRDTVADRLDAGERRGTR